MRSRLLTSPLLGPGVTLFFVMAALAVWYLFTPQEVFRITHERGPVERPTEWLYVVVALGMWALRRPSDALKLWLALSVTLLAFGMREMDLHKAWTGTSVLKVSFYLGQAPLHHRLVALAVLSLVALAVGHLLRRYAGVAWRALRQGHPVAITVACFLGTLVASKVFDRLINILAEDYQLVVTPGIDSIVTALEEILELGLPVLAATALLQHRALTGRRLEGR
ncbi:MAG: hypothetical protein EOP40_13145 [Rubrivivax sp.]|nr:MAG: hypothetical protein EOP40_13145 [Rubrivivax sp.]